MWLYADDDAIRINLGVYTLHFRRDRSDKIAISHASGEGGEFSRAMFEDAIHKFYEENF